MIKKLLIV